MRNHPLLTQACLSNTHYWNSIRKLGTWLHKWDDLETQQGFKKWNISSLIHLQDDHSVISWWCLKKGETRGSTGWHRLLRCIAITLSLPLRMGNSCCHELRALLTVDIQRWLVRQMAKMLTKDKVFQVLRQGRVTQLTSVWFLPSLFCSFSPLCSREGAYELQFGLGYL